VGVNPDIRRYLDEHGATYTTEALRRGLLDAQHDPVAVEEAIREWEAERAGSQPLVPLRRRYGRWAFGMHVAALVGLIVLLVALKGTGQFATALLAGGVLAVALLIGWAVTSLIGRALLPRAGLLVALIAPAISALVLSGTCFALMSSIIPTPPRNGVLELTLLEPRAFEGSASAQCFVGGNEVSVSVAGGLGTLDGGLVTAQVNWHGSGPAPAGGAEVSVYLGGPKQPESYGVIFSTKLEIEAAADGLSGTIHFERLASDTLDPSAQPATPKEISGSVTWNCEQE
jgi:hypothetical protein